MKKNIKYRIAENEAQEGKEIKKKLPVKNVITDHAKNTASQSNGLNQANITSDDLFPSDGDNMTQ